MELSKKDNLEICHICDTNPEYAVAMMTALYDYLGVVSKEHFSEVYFMNKRTVQRKCKNGVIPTFYGSPVIRLYENNSNT